MNLTEPIALWLISTAKGKQDEQRRPDGIAAQMATRRGFSSTFETHWAVLDV
jgi:hypothetical protein